MTTERPTVSTARRHIGHPKRGARSRQRVDSDLTSLDRVPKVPRAASRIRRTTTAMKIKSHSIWHMTTIRAGSVNGVMSPKPTVENTVTVK